MRSLHTPSRLSVIFDDDHAVANAGLSLAALLSEFLGSGLRRSQALLFVHSTVSEVIGISEARKRNANLSLRSSASHFVVCHSQLLG